MPGESDYLVRGPADARWARAAAYEHAGLPRNRPPPLGGTQRVPSATTALLVDRKGGRGLNATATLEALSVAGVDADRVVVASDLVGMSFAEQVRLFEAARVDSQRESRRGSRRRRSSTPPPQIIDTQVVVAAHGAALTNSLWLREGAAIVELKQYGEFSTTFRDLAAVASCANINQF